MKSALSILTILALTLGSLRECVVVLSFALNRPFIAKNLCEKRDQPGNTCQGCCQLRKQLDNQDRRDQATASRVMKELDDLQPVVPGSIFRLLTTRQSQVVSMRMEAVPPLPPADQIDHPPESLLG